MGAYSVLETDEWTGGIVFAKSHIEARRIGANLWGNGEIGGLTVNRRRDLDIYEASGVPAYLLVGQGWHFECCGCGMSLDEDALFDAGMDSLKIVGNEGGMVYCCHACRMDSNSKDAAIEAFGAAFLDMLRDMVRERFPTIDHCFGDHRHHVYVPRYRLPLVVLQASVSFSYPGMKYGPATLSYRHVHDTDGREITGPFRPEYFCCNGDRETFEEFIKSNRREMAHGAARRVRVGR